MCAQARETKTVFMGTHVQRSYIQPNACIAAQLLHVRAPIQAACSTSKEGIVVVDWEECGMRSLWRRHGAASTELMYAPTACLVHKKCRIKYHCEA